MNKSLTAAQVAIQQKLIKEAKKRGYAKGVVCKFGQNKRVGIISSVTFRYNPSLFVTTTKTVEALSMGNNIIWDSQHGWAPFNKEIVSRKPVEKEYYEVHESKFKQVG
ncbi:hypothetical protein JJL45_05275 [Tamlana sp. s12]|uniref:hypothetical protein n=1 Tax=Tamlana sp. s12 TaxID=1630406 RepID=UPI0007FDEE42|nr:hypothetical protein [Tamlana sp. s12]OBQ56084.1 hypothetical protein VQ01_06785 [Tamlana sp. s12]QQY83403.1 hypothetical protein JJL45_05275 [Tamlana sp. s12]